MPRTKSSVINNSNLLSKDDCIDLSKFYQDVLYKIILGIGAANVTLIGFGFKDKTSCYFFLAFILLLVCIIVFRYVKKTIGFLYLVILSIAPDDIIAKRYVSMFLRCDSENSNKELDEVARLFSSGEITDTELKSRANKLANPHWIPNYIDGIYPCLCIVSIITLAIFVTTIYIW